MSGKIFVVGNNECVGWTRAAVLSQTGAEVMAFTEADISLHWREQCNLLVLCHTIPEGVRRSISAEARERWRHLRILQIQSSGFGMPETPEYADGAVMAGSPKELVARASELLGGASRGPHSVASAA